MFPIHLSSLAYMRYNQNGYTTREELHPYNTEGRCELDLPRFRHFKTQSGSPVLTLKIFNMLPFKIKLLDKGRFFKVLKSWLVDAAYHRMCGLRISLLGWVGSTAALTCHPSKRQCSKSCIL